MFIFIIWRWVIIFKTACVICFEDASESAHEIGFASFFFKVLLILQFILKYFYKSFVREVKKNKKYFSFKRIKIWVLTEYFWLRLCSLFEDEKLNSKINNVDE